MHNFWDKKYTATFLINLRKQIMFFLDKKSTALLLHINKAKSYGITYLSDMKHEWKTLINLRKKLHRKRKIKQKKQKQHKKLKEKTIVHFRTRTKLQYFLLGLLFACIFICIPLFVYFTLDNLPSPYDLAVEQAPQTTKIFDRHHTLLYEIYATENRTIVPLSTIPLTLQQATIAIEDKNFYKNPGIDLSAIIRAAWADIRGYSFQGGSTITQQLVKESLLSSKRSLIRKAQELILAFWAEKIYTKPQIMTMYLNRVPYGGTAWGVESAAEVYFGKSVKELDLAQSAFLAGLPQAPSQYSPYSSTPHLWKDRQKDVLSRMNDLGYITNQQKQDAIAEPLTFKQPFLPFEAPHFVMYIKDLLIQKYGISLVEKGGLQVITSLDLPTQQMASDVVAQEIRNDSYLQISNGATLITNPKNGDILAMVGSHDYTDPQDGTVNITTSLRQPGSTMKLITYSAALSHGFTATTQILDTPTTFKQSDGQTYSPVNYDGKFHGMVTLRSALANSFNIPAVKTLQAVGLPTFFSLAHDMGITSLTDQSQYGLSITLGGGEVTMVDMATAYGTVANQGTRVNLNPILMVTDATHTVLEEKKNPAQQSVLSSGIAYIISSILSDNTARAIEFGTNSPLVIPEKTVSVKTGTSDDKRDNWTIGYTPSVVVTTWVGNNDNTPMNPALASGITGAAPIWHTIMETILKNTPDEPEPMPHTIVEKDCFGRKEYFMSGTDNCNVASSSATLNQFSRQFPFRWNLPQQFFQPFILNR